MPRKQRFKPSRKPKIVDSPTDLPTLAGLDPSRSREISPVDIESDGRGHRTTDVFQSAGELGGESG